MKIVPEKLAACFALTRQEKLLLGGILAIAAVGLTARYVYLHNQKTESYRPAGVGQLDSFGPEKHPVREATGAKATVRSSHVEQ